MSEPTVGPYGTAEQVPVPSDIPQAAATVAYHLITAPAYHPLWDQYILAVVSLEDIEGFPPAHRQFQGASHELIAYALDPKHSWTVQQVEKTIKKQKSIPYLKPINICEQFEATDEEMQKIAELCCQAVVDGRLNPETSDAPERVREAWLTTIVKTLAHIRGEEHAP